MSKLKLAQRPVTVQELENDMYHCCRWCRNFDKGKCYAHIVDVQELGEEVLTPVLEDGNLSEALEETLHSLDFKESFDSLFDLLEEYGLSKKRMKEINKCFKDCMNSFLDFKVKGDVEETAHFVYVNAFEEQIPKEGVEISSPESFYCKEFR